MASADVKRPKRQSGPSHNARAMQLYRDLGFRVGKTEQRLPIPGKFITQDLFGCIDFLAIKRGVGIVGIQATSDDNHSHRVVKAKAEPALRDWLESGGRFEVCSFGMKCSDGRGSRKVWAPRRQELTVTDLVTP